MEAQILVQCVGHDLTCKRPDVSSTLVSPDENFSNLAEISETVNNPCKA